MKTSDGWLLVDGERAFKLQRYIALKDAAREVRKGALVGVLKWWEDDDFQRSAPPVTVSAHGQEIGEWLGGLPPQPRLSSVQSSGALGSALEANVPCC